jgi:hypothetical protein
LHSHRRVAVVAVAVGDKAADAALARQSRAEAEVVDRAAVAAVARLQLLRPWIK